MHNELPGRLGRFKLLVALEADFAGSGVMLPGGHVTHMAYSEVRAAFVAGHLLTVIVLAQSLIENLLGAHADLDDISREIKRRLKVKKLHSRPHFDDIIKSCLERGVLTPSDVANLQRVRSIRNPLIHYRSVEDEGGFTRRWLDARESPFDLIEADARFCISTVVALVGKPEFTLGRGLPEGLD